MSYFSFFGTLLYNDHLLMDLTKRIVGIDLDDPRFLYDEYWVQDGERPDSVSNKFYGVPYYHWVILVTNGLTLKTWPKSDKRFSNYIENKYEGTENLTRTWIDSRGFEVPYSFPASIETANGTEKFYFNGDGLGTVQGDTVYSLGESKSFIETEREQNDASKMIRILDKSFLGEITTLARSLLKE